MPVFKTSQKTDPLKHLRRDPVLKVVLKKIAHVPAKKDSDLYRSLMRAIVGQQLSVKAAATIWERFIALFPDKYPHANQILSLDNERMKAVGLSYQKAGYIKNIAQFSIDETLDYKKLRKMSDDELIEYLVQIKGVGRWTVEMILMFNLQREDVFPKDDLGIQKGMISLYKIGAKDKKQLLQKMEKIAEAWKPYRSIACFHIWKHKDENAAKK